MSDNKSWKDVEAYRSGKDNAMEGYPVNRFMRNNSEYMRGYNETRDMIEKAEDEKERTNAEH